MSTETKNGNPLHNFSMEHAAEQTCNAIRRNIDAIAKLEESFIAKRSLAERASDAIGSFSGTPVFVLLHVIWFVAWIVWNTGVIRGAKPFDPFPFLLLSVSLSMEAIFLSTFVLMKQNRMSKRADQRAHLDLQINLLAEREMTLVLRVLQRLATKLGVRLSNEEIADLSEETSVEALANALEEKLPPES